MEISLKRETLLKPLQNVIGVVERKQTLPILANVLIKVSDAEIWITGTDLEVELIAKNKLEHVSLSPIEFTVSGRKLLDICKALPEEANIQLIYSEQRLTIKSGRSRFSLSTLAASDFPSFEAQDRHLSFNVAEQDLLLLIQRTHFAMAQQDVRYYLNGLLLEATSGQLKAVATDGHRLATNYIAASITEASRLQIIVPRKGITELLRLLGPSDESIGINLGSNHIQISSQDFLFTCKLVEGRFPDYERVIPKNSDKFITIDRDELKAALARAAIICNEKFRGIRFELYQNLLRITANNPEQEVAEEEIAVHYTGPDLNIGFNVGYLQDLLNTVNTGLVKFAFTDSNSSTLIEEEHPSCNGLFVVMPMRL